MRSFFTTLLAFLMFGLLAVAIVGAFVALAGGVGGWPDVKHVGGVMAGGGALGFFAFIVSPFGRIFRLLANGKTKLSNDADGGV